MIGAFNRAADERAFEPRAQRGADEEVIDPPADVPRPRAREGRPPAVMSPALFKFPERVDESGLHQRIESAALLRRETVRVQVRPGIREVDLRMRHVEVAA